MISLIVSEAHKTLLAPYEELNVKVRVEKEKEFSLNTYVQEKMENLNLFTHLIIEEAVIAETREEMEEILKNLKGIYNDLCIVLYSETESETDEFIRISDAFLENTDKMQALFDVDRNIREEKNLNIGILSGEPRAGATTLAINMANYIKGFHPDVCYMERKQLGEEESSDLSHLAEHCNFTGVKPGRYLYRNLCYLKGDTKDFHTRVKDYGAFVEPVFLQWQKDDIRIIVSGAKAYELCFLDSFLKYIGEQDGKEFYLLFKSVPESEKTAIRERYLEERVKIGFIEYTPDFFEVKNKTLFFRILHKYLDIPAEPEEPEEKTVMTAEQKEKKPWKFRLLNKAGIAAIALLGAGTLALTGVILTKKPESGKAPQQTVMEGEKEDSLLSEDGRATDGRAPPELDEGMFHQVVEVAVEWMAEEGKKAEYLGLLKKNLHYVAKHCVEETGEWTLSLPQNVEETPELPEEVVAQNPDTSRPATQNPTVTKPAEPKPAEPKPAEPKPTQPEPSKPEEPSTEAPKPSQPEKPGKIDVNTGISLSGYHGQIYAGDNTAYLFRKFNGQKVALKLTTRTGSTWYNYAVSGNSLVPAASITTAPIDVSCSYYVQKIQINGEDVGLEFIQQ